MEAYVDHLTSSAIWYTWAQLHKYTNLDMKRSTRELLLDSGNMSMAHQPDRVKR